MQTTITELRGQWVVTVEQHGRRQQYFCETLTLARRWALLLGVPRRTRELRPLPAA